MEKKPQVLYLIKSMHKKVAIVYLCWSNEPFLYLEKALRGIADQTYSKDSTNLIIVYNFYKIGEQSAITKIKQSVQDLQNQLPETIILEQTTNLGFVGGNNVGIKKALDISADYVF